MTPRTVLVTGVGGNVGQGILRALADGPRPLRLVGTNTVAVSGGNHLCARVHEVPLAVDPGYGAAMAEVCAAEAVDLIIPATDQETVVLASQGQVLPPVAVAEEATCAVFLDKLRTAEHFAAAGLPFARTALPSHGPLTGPNVVKPRSGRGSRGVVFDAPDPASFDDDHVVQERAIGREVTVAGYVRHDGVLHGCVALRRHLENGATIHCTVDREVEPAARDLLGAIVDSIALRGSFNVQLIVTDADELVPFEVNCRLSGTTSVRHKLGFPDAQWTVAEWLDGEPPGSFEVRDGTCVRLLMDVVYVGSDDRAIAAGAAPFEVF